MPRKGTPCIEHVSQSYYALFIKYMNKVLWCCHTFALDSNNVFASEIVCRKFLIRIKKNNPSCKYTSISTRKIFPFHFYSYFHSLCNVSMEHATVILLGIV